MVILADVPPVILNLPIILSVIAIVRYVIGFKTWKNYPTLALALAFFSFYSLLNNFLVALLLWVLFVAVIIGAALVTRVLLRKVTMNYYARVATMYLAATVMSLITMAIIDKTALSPITSDLFLGLGVFLIGSTIDELATLQYKKDTQEFLRREVSTLGVGLLCGLLLSWEWWGRVLAGHHEILLGVLLIDVVVAAWSALRLTEFIRFGSLGKN